MRDDNKLTYSDIGAYLYKLRKELKLSSGEIARKARVSTRTIYNVENGCHTPRIPELARISSAYDMTLTDLFASADLYYQALI